MGEIRLIIQEPHIKQKEILDNRKRFNYLRCGRRFGKTSLVSILIAEKLHGYIGIFAPTYKDLHEIWIEVKHRFAPITASKNEQLKQLVFITGGKVDFWSLEDPNSGRGRKYHRVIIDEAEKIRSLKEAWEMTLRYTLMDYAGDSYMFTTPKGQRTYFDLLYNKAKEEEASATFQYSTADNPHIPRGEIEAILNTHDDLSLQQEFYGSVVDWGANNRFYYSFIRGEHVSKEPLLLNPSLPVWQFHDFNVNPMCALIMQVDPYRKWLRVIKEYAMPNSSTHDIARQILADFPYIIKYVDGDRTGWGRNAQSDGLVNNFEIIKNIEGLNWSQIKAPQSANPLHQITRSTGNNTFEKVDVLIDASCTTLINDLETAQADSKGGLVKDGNTENGKHAIDCLRYGFNTLFGDTKSQK